MAAPMASISPARTLMSTPTTVMVSLPLVIAIAAVEIASKLVASARPAANAATEIVHRRARSPGEVRDRNASRLVTTGTLVVPSCAPAAHPPDRITT